MSDPATAQTTRKLIVVFGATGKQGGSVIAHLLPLGQYRLRGITRDTSKGASRALEAQGVEMVSADMDDASTLNKALDGAYGVFAVTDYWATMDGPREIKQGKNMVDASKVAGVEHLVLSTLMSPKKFTSGALSRIEHFDSKAEVASYALSSGVPTTLYLAGFYMSNIPGQMFRLDPSSNAWVFALPIETDAQIPLIDIEADTGNYVSSIFARRDAMLGQSVYGSVKYYTPLEIVQGFKEIYPVAGAGDKARFVTIPEEAFRGAMVGMGLPEKAAEELTENMLLLNKKWGYFDGKDLGASNKILDKPAKTWEEYIRTAPAFAGLT